jgi:hypothetical protein
MGKSTPSLKNCFANNLLVYNIHKLMTCTVPTLCKMITCNIQHSLHFISLPERAWEYLSYLCITHTKIFLVKLRSTWSRLKEIGSGILWTHWSVFPNIMSWCIKTIFTHCWECWVPKKEAMNIFDSWLSKFRKQIPVGPTHRLLTQTISDCWKGEGES